MNGKEEKTEKAFSLIGCAMKNIMNKQHADGKTSYYVLNQENQVHRYVQTLNKHTKVQSNEVQQMNGKAIKKTEHFLQQDNNYGQPKNTYRTRAIITRS